MKTRIKLLENTTLLKVWSTEIYATAAGEVSLLSQPIYVCLYKWCWLVCVCVSCLLMHLVLQWCFLKSCLLSLYFLSRGREHFKSRDQIDVSLCSCLELANLAVWGKRKSDIVSGRNSYWLLTSSVSNWFPLWVDDSIWTPAFPIRYRATVCSIASSLCSTSLFCSNFLFYLVHHWSNSVHL